MYDETIPPLTHMLGALARILDKAEAHCRARNIDPAALLTARLYPDMFPFTRQVQLASDFAKAIGGRLSGGTAPTMPDTEAGFAALKQRLQQTVDYLATIPREAMAGADSRQVRLRVGGREVTLTGRDYCSLVALPQFYFHMTTAYDLLRHAGVEIGKADFLGRT